MVSYSNTTLVDDINAHIIIFARKNNGNVERFSNTILYEFSILHGNEEIRNFIPCYYKVNGEIGLFDLVEGIFYTNSGTGTFLKGNDINNSNTVLAEEDYIINRFNNKGLPYQYQEVEYIEATGIQYINTKLLIGNARTIKIINSFEISANASGDNSILGAEYQVDSYKEYKFPNWCNGLIEIRGYGISNNNVTTLDKLQRANMIFEYIDGSQKVILNNNIILNTTNQFQEVTAIPELYVLAKNASNKATWKAKAKLYKLSIELDNEIVRDFIPCYCKTTVINADGDEYPSGTIGLYDLVNDKFYTNSGTGEFIKGPNVD